MQHHANAVRFAIVGTVGIAAAVFLTLLAVQFAAPNAEATPAIGQGKPCNACHTSSSPSKNDVKK
jgi:putative flippase GtrA